jgi:hypothetical protein
MQYMLMCYFEEKLWDSLPQTQRDKIMQEYGEWTQAIVRSGHFRASTKLGGTSTATTIREKNGKTIIKDGPFAETKEQLGGVHLIECKDLDEALSIASAIPSLPAGGTIEVRPVEPTRSR